MLVQHNWLSYYDKKLFKDGTPSKRVYRRLVRDACPKRNVLFCVGWFRLFCKKLFKDGTLLHN